MMLLVLTFLNSVPVSVSLAVYLAECGPEKNNHGKISWLVFRFVIVYMHKNRFFNPLSTFDCHNLFLPRKKSSGSTVLIMLMEGCNSFISQPTITIWEVPECLTTSVLLFFLGGVGTSINGIFFKFAQ